MRRKFPSPAIVVIAGLLVGCGKGHETQMMKPAADNVPSITLDDAHNHASADATGEYSIPPCESLWIDAGSYKIPVPEKFKVSEPNALHVIHGSHEYFRVPWDGRGKMRIDAKKLTNIKGDKPFSGFISGEKYIVGIGADNVSESAKELHFSVMWVGTIKVQ
jgi:hypothetical protein